MPFKKPKKDLKTAILIPCYKRHDYTKKCVECLEKAQIYNNVDFFGVDFPSLRKVVIEFIKQTRGKYDLLGKVDNDCLVPKNWLDSIIDIFDTSDVDILSPNVMPSNAANKYGRRVKGLPYMPAKIVGGLWFMKSELTKGIDFEDYNVTGVKGAHEVLKQIILEKDPKVGWTDKVVFEDMGHWSGKHPEHVKTKDHEEYSKEVGREVAWQS